MVERSCSGELLGPLVRMNDILFPILRTLVALTALVAVLAESDIVVIAKVLPSFPV